MSEPKRAAGITFIVFTLFLIPDSPNPGNMNQQGWLPPCRPVGLRWQGQLNSNTHIGQHHHDRTDVQVLQGGKRRKKRMVGRFRYFSDTDLHGFTQIRCCTHYIICIF